MRGGGFSVNNLDDDAAANAHILALVLQIAAIAALYHSRWILLKPHAFPIHGGRPDVFHNTLPSHMQLKTDNLVMAPGLPYRKLRITP